jgi:hypothetical protein
VVNGIIASPFGVNHMMGNLYYNIHRLVYASTPKILSYPWLNRANEVSRYPAAFFSDLYDSVLVA